MVSCEKEPDRFAEILKFRPRSKYRTASSIAARETVRFTVVLHLIRLETYAIINRGWRMDLRENIMSRGFSTVKSMITPSLRWSGNGE